MSVNVVAMKILCNIYLSFLAGYGHTLKSIMFIKFLTRLAVCVQINEGRSPNHCCRGNVISITYSECVSVAVGIQRAMHMRRIILSSVAFRNAQYFSRFSHKDTIFGENTTHRHKMSFDFLYNFI
jgi:hypothetical protein